MAKKQRDTFAKREKDRARREKQEAKRARRQGAPEPYGPREPSIILSVEPDSEIADLASSATG
jgi:hypothetical protein